MYFFKTYRIYYVKTILSIIFSKFKIIFLGYLNFDTTDSANEFSCLNIVAQVSWHEKHVGSGAEDCRIGCGMIALATSL